MAYNPINWQNGSVRREGYVTIDGQQYPIVMPEYEGDTPINASNLNHMDEGIANVYGEVLYNGENETNITLLKNVSLFKRIKVGVISSDGHTNVVEILNPSNSSSLTTSVMLGSVSGSTYYGKTARIVVNGANLTVDRNSEIAIRNNNTSVVSASATAIRVYYVLGYYE